MIYHVIGLMSGSSLDGLDIAFVRLEEVRGAWAYELLHAECIPYTGTWKEDLRAAAEKTVPEFLELNTAYGHYLGGRVNDFIEKYGLAHKVHFIASHGHTAWHRPAAGTSFQLGDGASLAAETGLPVISDLRAMDVALGGQGAPIVPVGDRLLFGGYEYLLNIGGIANLTVRNGADTVAFDVCPANQVLNALAARISEAGYDEDGRLAASGAVQQTLLSHLDADPYYSAGYPKSLANDQALAIGAPVLQAEGHTVPDLLHTMCRHIAGKVAQAVTAYPAVSEAPVMLVTGGGALNTFLVTAIREALRPAGITVEVPETEVVQYKEAIVMALIGTLRWREETNVSGQVTGAVRDSCGGALWLG